jgi:hypothetical protein
MRNPTSETHRGVGVYVFQPAHRIALVKAAIDVVLANPSDVRMLLAYASDCADPAEARALAIAMIDAALEPSRERPAGFEKAKLAALSAKAVVDEVIAISESSPDFFWRSVAPALFRYAKDVANPPEGRMLAAENIKQAAGLALADLEPINNSFEACRPDDMARWPGRSAGRNSESVPPIR